MTIYMPDKRKLKFGLIGVAIVVIFLAVLIPSVTLRAAPQEPKELPKPWEFHYSEDSEVMKKIRKMLQEVPLIDSHNDLPYQYYKQAGNHLDQLNINKNLSGTTHTDIPRMKKGQMGGVFLAAYCGCETQYKDAIEFGLMQVDTIRRLTQVYSEDLRFATTADEIESAHREGKIATLIGLEGGHMINSNMAILRVMYDLGVRYMTLTHNCHTPWADNAYGDELIPDTKHDTKFEKKLSNGLNYFGKEIVTEMNRLGMMVDISHVSEETMLDAMKTSLAPVIFSHSSAFTIGKHRRNARDNVLKKLKENKGVLMINFWTNVIKDTEDYNESTMDDVIEHFNHVRDLIGVDYIGMGADYDGVPKLPIGVEDVSTYPQILARMHDKYNYSIDDLKKIAGLNILRVMREVEQVSTDMSADKANDDTLLYLNFIPPPTCSCRTLKDFTKEKEEE